MAMMGSAKVGGDQLTIVFKKGNWLDRKFENGNDAKMKMKGIDNGA